MRQKAKPVTQAQIDFSEGHKAGLKGEPMGFVSAAFDAGWTQGYAERKFRESGLTVTEAKD